MTGQVVLSDLLAKAGAAGDVELEALIREALPRDLREPLVLSAIEEMSGNEIAVALGIPEPKVRARVFRARQILRERLAAHMGVEHGN